ncbi:MAG: hypothetical protein ACRD3D_09160 [Terriglobia bacterium]
MSQAKFVVLIAALAVGSLLPGTSAHAARIAAIQPQAAQTPAQQGARQQRKQQLEHPNQPQIFTGTVVETAGAYILFDSATKTKYGLDNQHQAGQFKNKNVKVEGTLDAASNTIHVIAIRGASKS